MDPVTATPHKLYEIYGCCCGRYRGEPEYWLVVMSQRWTEPLRVAMASRRASALKARPRMVVPLSGGPGMGLPDAVSHSRIRQSAPPEARSFPSGVKASPV